MKSESSGPVNHESCHQLIRVHQVPMYNWVIYMYIEMANIFNGKMQPWVKVPYIHENLMLIPCYGRRWTCSWRSISPTVWIATPLHPSIWRTRNKGLGPWALGIMSYTVYTTKTPSANPLTCWLANKASHVMDSNIPLTEGNLLSDAVKLHYQRGPFCYTALMMLL